MSEACLDGLLTHRRRTLGALISMYESNFTRLFRLAPELDAMTGTSVSRVVGAQDLYLSVLERFKYTTTICLTYRFDEGECDSDELASPRSAFEPRARIRIYHDVRAVEVLSHSRRRMTRKLMPRRRGHMPELDRKWEMNRFLHKWLTFCLRQGHLFLCATSMKVAWHNWGGEPPPFHDLPIELELQRVPPQDWVDPDRS